jgi:hypothetical protein
MSEPAGATTFAVYSPIGRRAKVVARSQMPPLDTLDGKIIGELWDHLFKGDVMFEIIREEINKRYSNVTFVSYLDFGNTHGTDEREIVAAIPDKLREYRCDAVISAVGC